MSKDAKGQPADRSELDRLLAQAKQTETIAALEIKALLSLRSEKSPWTLARQIRARGLLDELDVGIKNLLARRRDLQLRLKVMSHAVQAARTYAKIGQAIR
ncbi:hypothetical protein [Dongia sp.]|uniref:hypothetical protein n=1 Tax=Dongia sp. TaxID=1977262 RepID=UPI0035B154EE